MKNLPTIFAYGILMFLAGNFADNGNIADTTYPLLWIFFILSAVMWTMATVNNLVD